MRARGMALALLAALLAVGGAAAQESADGEPAADGGVADGGASSTTPQADAEGPVLPEGVGPLVWQETHGRDCHRHAKRRVCEGPRRVPVPTAEAEARAEALGLGRPRTQYVALSEPDPTWVAAALEHVGREPVDLLWPVPGGRPWRGFGRTRRLAKGRGGKLRHLRARRQHEGVDIGAQEGSPIVAAAGGLVAYADNGMGGYGNALVIVHADGSSALYGHCSALYVTAGALVTRGQIVAAVGDTGLAHGSHLHFEWHVEGEARDPAPRFVHPEEPAAPETSPSSPPSGGREPHPQKTLVVSRP